MMSQGGGLWQKQDQTPRTSQTQLGHATTQDLPELLAAAYFCPQSTAA